ncbi:MAG: MtrB/PioB family decaheme-associated outer membrane protein [Gallionella sp.]|nr:MtrB/PioB family decaheme-associated outer membrane protein [Gallionella sp.]
MKITRKQSVFTPKLLALIVLAAFGQAHAAGEEDEAILRLTEPDSTVSVGAGATSGDLNDRTVFSQYNGLRKNDANILLNFDINKLDKDTGTWTEIYGRDLGLDNREIRGELEKQGDFELIALYTELVRHDIRTVNTGLQGAGTIAPTVTSLSTPGAGTDLNLDIARKKLNLFAGKWLTPNLLLDVDFKNEKKEGARLSGTGLVCSEINLLSRFLCSSTTGALLMLPEPINSTTRQIEAKLNYSDEALMLSGGYYASFYDNANGSLNPAISGNLWNPNGSVLNTGAAPGSTLAGYLQQAVALSPDNQAHQFYVSGSYAFTPTTRTTFKYSQTRATQNNDFASMGLTGAPVGVSSLGGAVDSSLAQLGLTARPMADISVLANLRLESKQDKTPLANYVQDNTGATYTNDLNNSSQKLTGKLEAGYQLPDNYRATLGVDYATVHRERPVATSDITDLALALSALRENTRELGYRAELRHSMSETLNGAISYVHSKRDGDNWLSLAPGFPAVSDATIYKATGTFPMTMMDRERDKLKLSMDWVASEDLSLQFIIENGKDRYTAPTEKGLHDTGMSSYGVDAALILSENWKMTGYFNQGNQTLNVDHSVGYIAELENVSTSMGIGLVGKQSDQLDLGGDLTYMNDSNRYKQSMSSGAALVGGGLPDVTYRVTKLKLFGKYALEKNADIRVDLVQQSVKFDEWSWGNNGTPFAYSDNSTVSMQQSQSATFLGVSYIYKFR